MTIYAISFSFIVLDFMTGLIKAVATNSFTSTKMREGLFHKVALLLCMILGFLVDHAQDYMDFGITVPVAAAVCVYICLMEITSIIENICKINPYIMPEKLASLFGGLKAGSEGKANDRNRKSDRDSNI